MLVSAKSLRSSDKVDQTVSTSGVVKKVFQFIVGVEVTVEESMYGLVSDGGELWAVEKEMIQGFVAVLAVWALFVCFYVSNC